MVIHNDLLRFYNTDKPNTNSCKLLQPNKHTKKLTLIVAVGAAPQETGTYSSMKQYL